MNSAHHKSSRRQIKALALLLAILASLMVLGALAPATTRAVAQAAPEPQGAPVDPLRGGRLYAAWDLVVGVNANDLPQNPFWPQISGSQIPSTLTWRCVNCHGWDYSGSDGTSLSGVYRTMGYPGLFSMTADPLEDIYPYLNGLENPEHDFTPYLAAQDIRDLAAFLSSSLVSPNLIADIGTFQASGTLGNGRTAYSEFCGQCHGLEGERINLGSVQTPIFLGDLAWSNPWRIAHIIRFGHLNAMVPAAASLDLPFSQQIDIVFYTQSLPNATIITGPDFLDFDASAQASTLPITIGAIAISLLIFTTVWITMRRRQ